MTFFRFILLVGILINQAAATVVIALGTHDGTLICEDTRITHTDSDGKVTYSDDTHKLQRVGATGVVATAGQIGRQKTMTVGGVSLYVSGYDVLSEVQSFFQAQDIRDFDEWKASQLETRITSKLQGDFLSSQTLLLGGKPSKRTALLLVWLNSATELKGYLAFLDDSFFSSSLGSVTFDDKGVLRLTPPKLKGEFITFRDGANSSPLLLGDGGVGYLAIREGKTANSKALLSDPQLGNAR